MVSLSAMTGTRWMRMRTEGTEGISLLELMDLRLLQEPTQMPRYPPKPYGCVMSPGVPSGSGCRHSMGGIP